MLFLKLSLIADDGKAFGEQALINDDCVRTASIVGDDVTDLIIVHRDLYNRSLAKVPHYFEINKYLYSPLLYLIIFIRHIKANAPNFHDFSDIRKIMNAALC